MVLISLIAGAEAEAFEEESYIHVHLWGHIFWVVHHTSHHHVPVANSNVAPTAATGNHL